MKKKLFIVLLATISIACSKNEKTTSESSVISKLKSVSLISASNKFGFDLLKKSGEQKPDSNSFISPFSALQALSMAYNGAKGQTKTEMAQVLKFENYSDKEVNEYNQSLSAALLGADEKVIFEIANSIWYDENFNVLQSFKDVNQSSYNADVRSANFQNSQTLDLINGWCNQKTHEKIPKILDEIPGNAVMYLLNAIYFKGTWTYSFDTTGTVETSFFKDDGSTVSQKQMRLEHELNYYSGTDFSMVELPYGEGSFNLVVLLPNSGKNLLTVSATLNDDIWKSAINNMNKTKMVVKIPRFKLEAKYQLKKTLINMGMPSAFSEFADFSGINGGGGILISKVIHKTYIELNETGTEAAAVTAVEFVKTIALPGNDEVKYFVANHPFIYAITEKSTGAILFIGKMMDPTVEKVEME